MFAMVGARILPLLAIAMVAGGCAMVFAQRTSLPQPPRQSLEAETPGFRLPSLFKGAGAPTFNNPGFEDRDLAGNPIGWGSQLSPEVRTEPAGEGTNAFGRVSRDHYYLQNLQWQVPPWQTVTVGCRVRGELSVETPRISFSSFGSGSSQFEPVNRARGDLAEWAPFAASMTRRPGEDSLTVIFHTAQNIAWIDVDDVWLISEGVANGGFEEEETGRPEIDRWAFAGGAERTTTTTLAGAGSLALPPGATASRFVAHTPHVVEYFHAARADGPIVLEHQPLDTTLLPTDGVTSATLVPDPEGIVHIDGQVDGGAQAARILLRNDGSTTRTIDDISRGWAYAFPRTFEPIANSPRPTVRLAAAWPGRLDTAEIALLDDQGIERRRLSNLQRDGTTIWTEFDGDDLPAGVYTARFLLASADGIAIAPERTFTIERGDPFPPRNFAEPFPDFVRMAWFYFLEDTPLDRNTVESIEQELAQARDDGFNHFFMFAESDQLDLIREATDRVGVPFTIFLPDYTTVFFDDTGNLTWDAGRAFDRLAMHDPLLGSPHFEGIYLWDEPNLSGSDAIRRVEEVVTLMQRDGRYPTGWTSFNPNGVIEGENLPLFSTFNYPYFANRTPEAALDQSNTAFESHIAYANSVGRDFWAGVQAYGSPGLVLITTAAEARAQLAGALALGARGYYAFLYDSFQLFSSLRLPNLEPTARLDGFRDFNFRVEALNEQGLLFLLGRERTEPAGTANVLARTARHTTTNDVYTFIVSQDVEAPMAVEIETPEATTATDVETGESFGVATTATLTLEPGDFRLLRFDGRVGPVRMTGTPVSGPKAPNAMVSILGEFEAAPFLGGLSLSPDGRYLGGRSADVWRVYSLEPGTMGTVLHERPFDQEESDTRFDDDTFLAASRRLGLATFDATDPAFPPLNVFERETGGAADAILEEDIAYLAQSF